ncbi:hypothetical protein MYX82_10275 [Acidobacteria bacterium AH-259-D05]|nr:hypothetical protein [Acidobacteria bacterium AH-259-D05]
MRRKPLATLCLVAVFGVIVFLTDIPKNLFTVRVADSTKGDVRLSPDQIDSLQGAAGKAQRRKAIEPGFVVQKKRPAQVSEEWGKPIDPLLFALKRDGALESFDMPSMAKTRHILRPYVRSLRLRGAQAGMSPRQVARLSAQVAAVAWRAQLVGTTPAEAVGKARSFGEKALSSAVKEQNKLSLMVGAGRATVGVGTGRSGTPPNGLVRVTQRLRQQQREQIQPPMTPSQE